MSMHGDRQTLWNRTQETFNEFYRNRKPTFLLWKYYNTLIYSTLDTPAFHQIQICELFGVELEKIKNDSENVL